MSINEPQSLLSVAASGRRPPFSVASSVARLNARLSTLAFPSLMSAALLVALLFAAMAGSRLAADDGDASLLEEVIQRQQEWRDKFVNLQVSWEFRALDEITTEEPLVDWTVDDEDIQASRLFSRNHWIWADHGLERVESEVFSSPDMDRRKIDVFHGPNSLVFRAYYEQPHGEPERLRELTIRNPGAGKPISRFSRGPFKVLYTASEADWLVHFLKAGWWTIDGRESLNGHDCVRLVRNFSGEDGEPTQDVLWLDRDHDFLVRRYVGCGVTSPPMDFYMDAFQQLENRMWFPKICRIHLRSGNQLHIVTDAAVNVTIDDSLFTPPEPQVGTAVDDRGRTYVHGVPSPLNVGASDSTIATGGVAPSATPPTSRWWSRPATWLGISLVFLLAGWWIRRAQQEA